MEQRKDRCIRSDPQRQRYDGDDRHEWALEERPERKLDVQHEGIDGICAGRVYKTAQARGSGPAARYWLLAVAESGRELRIGNRELEPRAAS